MPTHNHHLYLKRLLEYHNTEHDYKVLQVKQRMKEENEMLQNEMTSLNNSLLEFEPEPTHRNSDHLNNYPLHSIQTLSQQPQQHI